MPRTLAVIGFTFFLSLWLFLETSREAVIVAVCVSAVGFLLSLIIRRTREQAVFPTAFLVVISAAVAFNTQMNYAYKPALELAGDEVSVLGEVWELPYVNQSDRYCCVIRTYAVDGAEFNTKILLSSKNNLDLRPSDIVSFTGKVYVRGADDEDMRENLMSGGVWLGAYPGKDIVAFDGDKSLRYYILKIRQYTQETILGAVSSDEASVLVALLLGNTSFMDDGVYEAFSRSGILHLFAVSGFNLSLFSVSVMRFMEKRRFPRWMTTLIPLLTVLFIMAVTGFSQSCVRAGIMLISLLAGKLFRQRTDSMNSLGFAILLICLADPFQASSVGFHMSLFASGTVILVSPYIERRIVSAIDTKFRLLSSVMRYLISTFLISICVCIALFPVMMFSFGGVSTVAPIVNCFAVFASEWEMLLGFLAVVFSAVPTVRLVSGLLFPICGKLSVYLLSVAEFFSDFDFSYVNVDYTEMRIWFASVLVAISVIILMKTDTVRKIVYSAVLAAFTLIFTVSVISVTSRGAVTVTVPSAGNGFAVNINYKGRNVFIGNIGSYAGMRDVVDITRGHADVMIFPEIENDLHYTRLMEVIEYNEVVIPEITQETKFLDSFTVPVVAKNYRLEMSDNVSVEFMNNDSGSVFFVEANGKSILITANPGVDPMRIPRQWLSADVLCSASDVPKSLECEKYARVILSADEERGKFISDILRQSGADAVYTGDRSIILKINSKGFAEVKSQ